MSRENVEQVRRLYNDGWMAGNLDLALQLLHPEIVWTAIEAAGVALDERLVCANHAVGTGKGSGVRTEIRYAGTYRFADDGRIVEIHEYATLDEALEAAGLRE